MQTYIVKCPETGEAFVEEFNASAPEKQIADFIASSTVISSQHKHGFDCRGFKNLQFFTDDHAYSKGRRINAKVYEFLCQREYGDIVFTQHGENCKPRGMERQIAESLAAKINEDPEAVRKSIIKESEDAADAEGEITDTVRRKWFIEYGMMNDWDDEIRRKQHIASILHERDMAAHPEMHKITKTDDNVRCWHSTRCICGYGYGCDTSD